jgi:hypothetical protein
VPAGAWVLTSILSSSGPAAPLLRQLLPGLVLGVPGGLLLWYGLWKNARDAARTPEDGRPLRLGFATIAGALSSAAGALALVDVLAEFARGALFP